MTAWHLATRFPNGDSTAPESLSATAQSFHALFSYHSFFNRRLASQARHKMGAPIWPFANAKRGSQVYADESRTCRRDGSSGRRGAPRGQILDPHIRLFVFTTAI